jgi:mRNA interferase MazF
VPTPNRGEVWLVDLNPIRGREQAGRRPALVVSVDEFNNGPADLVPKQAYHNGLMPVRASVGRGAQGGVLDAAGGRVGVV